MKIKSKGTFNAQMLSYAGKKYISIEDLKNYINWIIAETPDMNEYERNTLKGFRDILLDEHN